MRSVEQALGDAPHYIMGDRFTAADILLSTCITWALRYNVSVADNVVAYNERVTARPDTPGRWQVTRHRWRQSAVDCRGIVARPIAINRCQSIIGSNRYTNFLP